MRAEITTWCRTGGTRSTRLNLLGWAALCPHASELLWHGSAPLWQPGYPTASESKQGHERLVQAVENAFSHALDSLGYQTVAVFREYEHYVGLSRRSSGGSAETLCASSRADLVYILHTPGGLVTAYVEVSSTRINVAKPWQALLRGVGLYYEFRLPVWLFLVSPAEVRYKLLDDRDQRELLRRLQRSGEGFEPSPDLCSLCELAHYCPYKVV